MSDTFVMLAVVASIAFGSFIGCKSNKEAPKCSAVKVLRIGGCDSTGLCGVFFENGMVQRVYYPVQGAAYNVCVP
jgi:hypothetical protein